MAIVRIPGAWTPSTCGENSITIDRGTVGELLDELTTTYPDLRKRIFTTDGRMASWVNVYVQDENIRDLEGLKTSVTSSDPVIVIPALAGG
ncbi:MoaD/ThiS family protein [Streptomyces sp. DSM 41987]|uniref:MoaD/ThiS family protein n=1 Tax=Streptomyces TaxID=1883 RepID=UPI00361B09E9